MTELRWRVTSIEGGAGVLNLFDESTGVGMVAMFVSIDSFIKFLDDITRGALEVKSRVAEASGNMFMKEFPEHYGT